MGRTISGVHRSRNVTSLGAGLARVLYSQSVSVRLGDRVVVSSTIILANIGSVAGVEWLVVELAVSALGLRVLGDDKGVEEVAGLVGAVGGGAGGVLRGDGLADGGALGPEAASPRLAAPALVPSVSLERRNCER